MMKKVLAFAILIAGLQVYGQEKRFHVPYEVQEAYENKTRAWNGAPGENYWQNTVDYKIEVAVDPSDRSINGSQSVTYYNNSPNDLTAIVVRLYYDIFKKGNVRGSSVNPDDVGEGVELGSLKVDGAEVDLGGRQVSRNGTNLIIRLPQPLATGESIDMEMSWKQYVPLTLRRTGVYDSTSFFIAYWYPQVAVYDDVFGWDTFNYGMDTEFYNNLANFDVKITAPENFLVWATGVLQNAQDVYPDQVYERYAKAKTSMDVINVVTDADLDGYKNKSGTWHYTAQEVSDFAFSMSDHYVWDATSQKVSGQNVLIGSVYPKGQAEAYKDFTTIQQKTMKHFSEDMPGIPYPYPEFTTFIGLRGGGMEFPMMANNAGPGRGTAIHEMFHMYFPMYVRINERRFAHMDEGWANYITSVVTRRYFENVGDEPEFIAGSGAGLNGTIGNSVDLPLITGTQFMDNSNYGYASYPLPAFFYSLLHHTLGDEMFTKCFREYIKRWAKKSPTPYDFMYSVEDVSGQDLGWLFKPWFYEYGTSDVAIQSMKKDKVVVENLGNRPVPVEIQGFYKDGTTESVTAKASVWQSSNTYSAKIPNYQNLKFLVVNKNLPDGDMDNNLYPSIEEIYKNVTVDEAILGRYAIKEYPVFLSLSMEEGKLFADIENTGIESFMLPKNAMEFMALSDNFTITFEKEENGEIKSLKANYQGIELTGQKQ